MCDSRQPLNGADSTDYFNEHGAPLFCTEGGCSMSTIPHLAYECEYLPETPALPVWVSRAVNGGWDQPMPPQAQDGAQAGTELLRLVA